MKLIQDAAYISTVHIRFTGPTATRPIEQTQAGSNKQHLLCAQALVQAAANKFVLGQFSVHSSTGAMRTSCVAGFLTCRLIHMPPRDQTALDRHSQHRSTWSLENKFVRCYLQSRAPSSCMLINTACGGPAEHASRCRRSVCSIIPAR